MLNIFADALLTAVRLTPPRHEEQRRFPNAEAEPSDRRRWFTLTGMRR